MEDAVVGGVLGRSRSWFCSAGGEGRTMCVNIVFSDKSSSSECVYPIFCTLYEVNFVTHGN